VVPQIRTEKVIQAIMGDKFKKNDEFVIAA
jgi:hypothetical protein